MAKQVWTYSRVTGEIRQAFYSAVGQGTFCLDARNGSTRNKTPVQIYPCNGTDAQRWSYAYQPGILSNAEGRVLDVQGGNSAVGTPIWLYDQNNTGAQFWGSGYWCN
jgi:Ricin-type beta-trefoil lectin domain